MRLLVRKRLYRAFPELDRFSDEQCVRFVRAAYWSSGFGKIAAVGLGAFLLVSSAGVFTAAALLLAWLDSIDSPLLRGTGAEVIEALIAAVAIAPGPLLTFLVRDFILRRRLSTVINTRGRCVKCGYSLLGLPVPADLQVICPECGLTATADASLGELTIGASGERRFTPSEHVAKRRWLPRWLTARRLKQAGLVVLILALLGAAGYGGWWWLREQRLQAQALLASGERPTLDDWQKLVIANNPGNDSSQPNAWNLLESFFIDLRSIEMAVLSAPDAIPSGVNFPGLSYYAVIDPEPDPQSPRLAEFRVDRDLSRRVIERLRESGGFDKLREAARTTNTLASMLGDVDLLASISLDARRIVVRQTARVGAASLHMAWEAKDLSEFVESLDTMMGITALERRRTTHTDLFTALALEAVTYEQVRAVLMASPSQEWIEAVQGVFDRRVAEFAPDWASMEADRLFILENLCDIFENVDFVKSGTLFSSIFASEDKQAAHRRLGTYAENRDAVNAAYAEFVSAARQERWQRAPRSGSLPGAVDLDPVFSLVPSFDKLMLSIDRGELERRGLRTMIALERHSADTGGYPPQLQHLVPKYVAALPLDPWSGRPLGYKLLASPDSLGRRYLLYSVGSDGQDDGGHEVDDERNPTGALQSRSPGLDYLINKTNR